MPRVEDISTNQVATLQRVPDGYAWTIIRAEKRVNRRGNEVYVLVTEDDDHNEQCPHHVQFLRHGDRMLEAVKNGEVVYLVGGWTDENDYDGYLVFA